MSEHDLGRELDALRARNEQLEQRLRDAEQALAALASGEVDAVAQPTSATPILLHAAQEKLRSSQRLLRAVFEGSLDAIMLADDRGRYVEANPAACTLFGLAREELIGRSIGDFAGAGQDAALAGFAQFRELGQMSGLFVIHRPDGAQRTLDYTAVANVAPGLHLSVLRDITEKLAAEEALRRSEALFRAVIQNSVEVISLTSADGATRYLTPSASRILGWMPDEVSAQTLLDQAVPEDRALVARELERLARTRARDMSLEFRVQHRDGSLRWIEARGINLLDDPDVRAIVGNHRDITARKVAEQALRESRDLLEEAQAIAHIGSWTAGIGHRTALHWSPECYRIFGVAQGAPMTVGAFFLRVHRADRGRVIRASRAATESNPGAPFDLEHRILLPGGAIRRVHQRAIVERDGAGRATRIVGTVQDITERHAAGEALRQSEERYRRIVENTSDGIWMSDAQGATTFMNPRMVQMLGVTREEAVGLSFLSFVAAPQLPAARAWLARCLQGIAERGETALRRRDGGELWTSYNATPLVDASGGVEAVLVLLTDVSERKTADEARARLAAIVESSEDAIISVGLDGRIASWNLGAEKLYQYAASEMLGQSIFRLIPPELIDAERHVLEQVARGEPVRQYEIGRLRKDGSGVEVSVTASPIRDGSGAVIGLSKIARDLTERRKTEAALRHTEEQFRQAQKMEAVGRLAGGVAHDFNNLLSVILSYSDFAIADLKPGDPMRDDMEHVHAAALRAAELTRQLLAFSRQQVLEPRVLDLNLVVTGMQRMLSRVLGEDIELSFLPTDGLGRVLADPGQIEQVLMNLAVNARDAMPMGGKLTIATENIELDAEYVRAHVGAAVGSYAMVAISDTGTGMDASTQARIFEPFFTTKEKGKGTGLGLSTVLGIVQQSGGYVGVYSELEHGTTFKIYLPRTDRADRALPEPDPAPVLRGSETILLVEDEQMLRAVACAILRRSGYHVLEASNGGEAFLISKQFPAKIHLMLTDVVMPRMSGRQLAEVLAPQRPEMQVLFASGYTDDAIVHHGVLDAGVAFLQKPFTPDSLLRKVREVLGAALEKTPQP